MNRYCFQFLPCVPGCFRLGNQDLEFEIGISDFPMKHDIQNWFCLMEKLILLEVERTSFQDFDCANFEENGQVSNYEKTTPENFLNSLLLYPFLFRIG